MKNAFFGLLALLITFTLTNCKKTEEEVKGLGDVVIEMDNHAGDEILEFGKSYVTAPLWRVPISRPMY